MVVVGMACRRGEPALRGSTAASTSAITAGSSSPSPPQSPWWGKKLHVWTTACTLGARDVGDLVGLVPRAPRVGIGVACTSVAADGRLLTLDEEPVGLGRALVARRMRRLGLAPLLVVSNYGSSGFDGKTALGVLEKKRGVLVDAIARAAETEGFAGVELDLELLPTEAAAVYAALAREVRARTTGELAIDVHPKTQDDPGWLGPSGHDYAALAGSGAVLRLMTYDLSIGPVPPGPSTKASWIRAVVGYARSKNIPAAQLEIGLPAYGYDFPPKGAAVPLRWEDVMALRSKAKAEVVRDAQQTPHFTYEGENGRHEVWFDDATSLSRLLDDVADLAADVRGISIWGMGRADPDLGKRLAERGFAVAAAPVQ